MRIFVRIFVVAIGLLLILFSCARQTVPDGGPRDTIPPTLITSVPADKALNFHSRTIELTFDEFVQLNDPTHQIIITPRIGRSIRTYARRNKVVIEVDADWADSTTYTVNFREAIQDVTERNPAKNLKLAFSTGNYIDSLSIAGSVYNLLTGEPAKEVVVGALINNDTIDILRQMPMWFTETDKSGQFLIENLKRGDYFLYAMDDKNSDLIVNSNSEAYGFDAQTIQLDSSQSNFSIPIIQVASAPLKVIQTKAYKNHDVIRMSTFMREFKLTSDSTSLIASYVDDPSQVQVYPSPMVGDSLQVRFQATDSLNESIDTLLYIKLDTTVNFSESFTTRQGSSTLTPQQNLFKSSITFSKPLQSIIYDSLFIQRDSTFIVPIRPADVRMDSINNILTITRTIAADTLEQLLTSPPDTLKPAPLTPPTPKIYLIGKPAAFISIDSDSSKTRKSDVEVLKPESTGIILADVKTSYHFILQLLDQKFSVVDQEKDNPHARFQYLKPGTYQLRLLIDFDNDGHWNPGNVRKGVPPEPVVFYKNDRQQPEVAIKANWELGPLLITYE